MVHRRAARGDTVATVGARRRVRRKAPEDQGQPDRRLDVRAGGRVHRVERRACEPARLRRLPVDRLPDVHDARRAGRGSPLRPVGRDRQDRVRHSRLIPLVAVAHGSRDPRAAATVTSLVEAVRSRAPRVDVRAAFLDHCAPSLPQVLALLAPDRTESAGTQCQCVVLPLLLTAAYHSKADIPAQLAATVAAHPGLDVVSAGTLGPHALLLAALERRLREAGVAVDDAATGIVLAAAGASDRAVRWARERGGRAVVPAYASAAGPRPADAVRALRDAGADRVAVATYLL